MSNRLNFYGKYLLLLVSIVLVIYIFLRLVIEVKSESIEAPGGFIKVDGLNVHYVCKGAGAYTIIFETGFGSDSYATWDEISEQTSKNAKSCYYDRLGYGWSDPVPDEFGTQQQAYILAKIIGAVSDELPSIIVAHSYGGIIARRAISNFDLDISALILVDSAHENQHGKLGDLLPPIPRSVAEATYYNAIFGLSRIKDLFSDGSDINSRRLAEYYGSMKYSAVLENYVDQGGFFTPLSEAAIDLNNMPLVVMEHDPAAYPDTPKWNKSNKIWGELQTELAGLSKHSTKLMVPNASHNIPNDNPQAIIDAIIAYSNSQVNLTLN